MVGRLRSLGVRAVECAMPGPDVFPRGGCFDVVSVLNLLDRCDDPQGVLQAAKRLVRKGSTTGSASGSRSPTGTGAGSGLLLLAVVLPFRPFVEDGVARRAPARPLAVGRANDPRLSQEAMATEFEANVLAPAGLRALVYSRVPYLCEGDGLADFYTLPDTLFVCDVVPQEPGE